MSSDPAWTEIRVEVPVGWEELVSENLGEPPGTGAVIGPVESDERPAGDGRTWVRTYVPPGDDIASARVELAARLERLAEAVGDADLERLALDEHAFGRRLGRQRRRQLRHRGKRERRPAKDTDKSAS